MSGQVALTGATGFIGGHIAGQLLAGGYPVRALTRRPQPPRSGLTWIEGDLSDPQALTRLIDGVDAVIHCAGAVRGASRNDFNRVNVEGTKTLLDGVVRSRGSPGFLLISSLAAREPALSWYAESKRAAETLLEGSGSGLNWTVLRPPAVYGPGDREIVPLFRAMRRGWLPQIASPGARFSLLHAADLARAVRAWLDSETSGCIFELDDGEPRGYDWESVRRLAEEAWRRPVRVIHVPASLLRCAAELNLRFARITGRMPMLTPGKVRELTHTDWVCDNTRIVRSFDWVPEIRLSDSLADPALAGL